MATQKLILRQRIDDFKLIGITKAYAVKVVGSGRGSRAGSWALISRLEFKVFGDYNHSTVLSVH